MKIVSYQQFLFENEEYESSLMRKIKQLAFFINDVDHSLTGTGFSVFREGASMHIIDFSTDKLQNDVKDMDFVTNQMREKKHPAYFQSMMNILETNKFELGIQHNYVREDDSIRFSTWFNLISAVFIKKNDKLVFQKIDRNEFKIETVGYSILSAMEGESDDFLRRLVKWINIAPKEILNNQNAFESWNIVLEGVQPMDIASVESRMKKLSFDLRNIRGAIHGKKYGI